MHVNHSYSHTDLVRKVKGAFLPLRCAVEVEDGAAANAPSILRLRVMNPGKRAFTMPKITLGNLREERELDFALGLARRELQRRGYA